MGTKAFIALFHLGRILKLGSSLGSAVVFAPCSIVDNAVNMIEEPYKTICRILQYSAEFASIYGTGQTIREIAKEEYERTRRQSRFPYTL